MKKIILICMIVTVILLAGCGGAGIIEGDDKSQDNISGQSTVEQEIKDAVMDYYKRKLGYGEEYETTQRDNYIIMSHLKSEVVREFEITIYKTKPFGDKYLVLAGCHDGDGHPPSELLLLQKTDDKYTVSKEAFGDIPISMAFTINSVVYENNTILFSVLRDRTWLVEPDESKEVSFDYIITEFENGESIKEIVTGDRAYIIILEGISDVKDMNLFNSEGKLQTSLEDLVKYGSMGRDSEFSSVEKFYKD
ncbi:hypothetical protein RBH29_09865 [Herbivorax sp. ANBcel31]|uniref:hypothetical protein n=1 Tax=Herbivorax sp. ANBcel31 TaxID=3069754 RepID=UPI0027B19C09|nr:hypothetical protein [Herbivorax sp. ANBcel31]MDQ2086731.1 hypothetical protein [Herbivorax sp. ANBcel31]